MTNLTEAAPINSPPALNKAWSRRIGVITVSTAMIAVAVTAYFAFYSTANSVYRALPPSAFSIYPTGVGDVAAPSQELPPGPTALAGYRLTYVTNFTGSSLPAGWVAFAGAPAGNQFAPSHVVVSDGLLNLSAWKDPAFNNEWVTGGLCQCGVAKTYGAYFVRSRTTGGGANEAQLLWPATNLWPPEIDFNENAGSITSSSSTIHWSQINQIDQRHVDINMEQWHTWGVVWSRTSVLYVVDGQVWGSITNPSEIAKIPMTLDLEQRTGCNIGRQCPTHPVSMLVDWVAEYSAK